MKISDVLILTMEDGPDGHLLPPFIGDILIEGSRIQKIVGHDGGRAPRFLAMPGLINTHGHAAMSLFRGFGDDMSLMSWLNDKIWPVEAKLTAADVRVGSDLAILEMIMSGTTTFADMYFECEALADSVEASGIRASIARGLTPNAAGEQGDKIAEAMQFALKYQGAAGGRITTMLGPHAPYTCNRDFLARLANLGREHGLPLHIHLAETLDEIAQIEQREGCRPVEFLEHCDFFRGNKVLAAHGAHLNTPEIKFLRQYDVSVAHNPVSNLKLASGLAPVPEMLAQGLNVSLGTDSACSNNNLDLFEEIKAAALVAKVRDLDPLAVPAAQALRMATVNGAKALGLEAEIGTLSPGKQADIILINLTQPHFTPRHDLLSHLVYAANGSDVDTVIVAGRVLMAERQVTTMDAAEVLARAEQTAQDLCYNR